MHCDICGKLLELDDGVVVVLLDGMGNWFFLIVDFQEDSAKIVAKSAYLQKKFCCFIEVLGNLIKIKRNLKKNLIFLKLWEALWN